MKSSENTSLVYIFPDKIWLAMNDVFVFTILWSFSHHQNTIQICQKCKEGKCCSTSVQNWYDTIYFIILMQSVRDFFLKSPLICKTACKRIQSQTIQKSRAEATKMFWANGWKPSVLDGFFYPHGSICSAFGIFHYLNWKRPWFWFSWEEHTWSIFTDLLGKVQI